MALDPGPRRSRRAIIAGAAGALAALGVGALGPAERVLATHQVEDVQLGASNNTPLTTAIIKSTADGIVFVATASGTGAGIQGESDAGIGVNAYSNSGDAIHGISPSGIAVHGSSTNNRGVHGDSVGSDGVYGTSSSSGSSGVRGENTADGIGVRAVATHGIALYVEPLHADAVAIKALGVTQFARSGMLTIGAGKSAITKTGIRVDPKTLVLATLQQDRAGIYVRSAVPNASGDSFTIRLNKAVSSSIKVGWFLVN